MTNFNMIPKSFCQSCSMPIDDMNLRGTEKNGTKSIEYCSYCYKNGAFINPGATLEDMKVIVRTEMEKRHIDEGVIKASLSMLPYLKRWKHYARI